jgi:hypothetical protein
MISEGNSSTNHTTPPPPATTTTTSTSTITTPISIILIDEKCGIVYNLFITYVYKPNIVLGVLLNLICILIFNKVIKKERVNSGNMFKYLLMKSWCDFINFIFQFPEIYYHNVNTSGSYLVLVWRYVFYYYLSVLLGVMSVLFEIASSFDCYVLISMRFQWFKTRVCFYSLTIIIILFSFIFYVPALLEGDIQLTIINNETSSFILNQTSFIENPYYKFYIYGHEFLQDILPLICLFFINILILTSLKQATERRRLLETTVRRDCRTVTRASTMLLNSQIAERNKIKMTFLTSLLYLLHIPIMIRNFADYKINEYKCLTVVWLFLFQLSYSSSIISYILFNNTFRKYFFRIIFIN